MSSPAGADQLATGYFILDNIKTVSTNTLDSQWNVTLVPPRSTWGKQRFDITLTDLTINPQYANTPNERSAPLVLHAVSAPAFSLSVAVASPGGGTIIDSTNQLNCGMTCSHDFGQSVTVHLTAVPATDFVFGSWSGACSGAAPGCAVTLSGTPLAATASFREGDFQAGNFVPVSASSTCGFSVATSASGTDFNLLKGGSVVYTQPRHGQGTWNAFFNPSGSAHACDSAIIVERGVPQATPTSRQEVSLLNLVPSPALMATSQRAANYGKIMLSPDGRVYAISREDPVNPTHWWVDYFKAAGANLGKLLGTADMASCDATMQGNPFPRMESGNFGAVQCFGNQSKPWNRVHLQ